MGLAHVQERRFDGKAAALVSRLGCQSSEILEGADEGGPTIRVARIIERIHPNEERPRARRLGPP
jgi:hypothetical protein